MNILDILILVVLAFSLCAGMYKGFMSSVLATIGLVASWLGAKAVYVKLSSFALSNETLMGALSQYLEPEQFFESGIGNTLVSSLSGQTDQIKTIADNLGSKIPFLRDAFQKNLESQSFSNLNITTVSEYFDQTLWQSVFNVAAFILAFIAFFVVALLVVNLLDHVFRFPVLRGFDALLGGIFGIARGIICVILLLAVLAPLSSMVAPEFVQGLIDESALYATIVKLDVFGSFKWISSLIS